MDDEEVLAYLEAENEYFDASMAPYQGLIDTIYKEIEGRQPAELASLPRKRGEWYYQWKYGEGSEYRQWLRWPASDPDAPEGPTGNVQVFLDEPELAGDLETGELFEDKIENMRGQTVWSLDDSSFFYTSLDDNGRPWRVRRHILGDPVEDDTVVYVEADPGFFVGVSRTVSKEYVISNCSEWGEIGFGEDGL